MSQIEREARQAIVFDALADAAERGARAPTNWQLATLVGARSTATAADIVASLEASGAISVRRTRRWRVVTIIATGKSTALDDSRRPRRTPLPASAACDRPDLRPSRRQVALRRELAKDDARRLTSLPAFAPIAAPSLERLAPVMAAPARPLDPRPPALSRGPCPRCGTRGELGCAHQAPFEPLQAGVAR